MRKRMCNRCNGWYRPRKGGVIELKWDRRIKADLCPDCAQEMVDAYQAGVE